MRTQKQSLWIGCLVAVGMTILVVFLRTAIGGWLHKDAPLLIFVATTIVSAWYGGLAPGLLATALSAGVGAYYFAQPSESLLVHETNERVWLVMFVVVGAMISLVCEALWRARRRAEASAQEALQSQRDLEDADRRKNEFLAVLAHELRNPLAAVSGAVAVLERTEPADALLRQCRDVIARQTDQLGRLVDDLLDISRISRGKVVLRRETVDLANVVERAVESSLPLIHARDHHLEVELPDEPLWVRGDLVRLVQVAANLLTNAAKYTPGGGQIRLSAARDNRQAVLRVSDTGVGVPAELLPRIFHLFMQADRSFERSEGGLGIGLSLVRQLVEMHGGTVEAFSDGPDRGSEFVVRLPLSPVAGPPGRCESDPAHSDDSVASPKKHAT